jgi:hypothetical protein
MDWLTWAVECRVALFGSHFTAGSSRRAVIPFALDGMPEIAA